jgi:hypothetical protein
LAARARLSISAIWLSFAVMLMRTVFSIADASTNHEYGSRSRTFDTYRYVAVDS